VFVVRVLDKYLRVARNARPGPEFGKPGGRARTLVADLHQATTWNMPGFAKAAIREAMEVNVIGKNETCEVVPVTLQLDRTAKALRVARVRRSDGGFEMKTTGTGRV
jgi:hypothetical protein